MPATSPTGDKPATDTKVIVGMSGGVDSSVAALLLRDAGYQVQGLFMKNWEEDDGTEYCTAQADLVDARRVCERLGIELFEANFAAEYWDNVFAHFLEEYRLGRTPNPDILCNREIKFKVFLEYAQLLGADLIATGHYARLKHENGQAHLLKAVDHNKDQSYFLQSVAGDQLRHCLFPVGELHKPKVRAIAEAHGLATFDKKDSTGICFIGERRFKDFLEQYLPAQPGQIMTLDDVTLGEHQGLMFYTLGQRQGLGIGGVQQASEEPWYVVEKDLVNNILRVAQGNQHHALFCTQLSCQSIAWINGTPDLPVNLAIKVRYRQADQQGQLRQLPDGSFEVIFEQPQRAVTPGQWACFYAGDECLGGGIIDATATTTTDTTMDTTMDTKMAEPLQSQHFAKQPH
ncbi:MAG: tRNA-specific 2-thiouridylase [Candidatus Azotimanducaceae bacterium]|jgi:tRNA-specific 2-thiouridylase